MKAVMLVGGEGTRLRPLTLDTPKPLMPVGGRPFLAHVMAQLAAHGVDEAILTTGYLADAFDDFPEADRHGVRLTVVREPDPLGTCGAVANVLDRVDGTFLVLNGDVLTDLDLSALIAYHREKQSIGTITLTPVEDPSRFGLVPLDPDGRIQRFIEKPRADEIVTNLINAGTYVLEPEIFEGVPRGEFLMFERHLFPQRLAAGAPMYGFRDDGYWLDVGTPQSYLRANHDVVERKAGLAPPGTASKDNSWVGEGASIAAGARVRGPAAIGSECRIDDGALIYPLSVLGDRCAVRAGARVEESVLHDDVHVGEETSVERSMIGRGATIGPRCRIADAVIGPGVSIGADNELRAGVRIFPGLQVPDATIRF